jgi:hypothetical protein
MLTQNFDADSADVRVGYESALLFSREYDRLEADAVGHGPKLNK